MNAKKKQYFLILDGLQQGPFSFDEVTTQINQKKLGLTDLVAVNKKKWQRLIESEEFKALFEDVRSHLPPPPEEGSFVSSTRETQKQIQKHKQEDGHLKAMLNLIFMGQLSRKINNKDNITSFAEHAYDSKESDSTPSLYQFSLRKKIFSFAVIVIALIGFRWVENNPTKITALNDSAMEKQQSLQPQTQNKQVQNSLFSRKKQGNEKIAPLGKRIVDSPIRAKASPAVALKAARELEDLERRQEMEQDRGIERELETVAETYPEDPAYPPAYPEDPYREPAEEESYQPKGKAFGRLMPNSKINKAKTDQGYEQDERYPEEDDQGNPREMNRRKAFPENQLDPENLIKNERNENFDENSYPEDY